MNVMSFRECVLAEILDTDFTLRVRISLLLSVMR